MTALVPLRQKIDNTNLSVSPLCLGGNRFGSTLNEHESFALLDEFVELGGNFIDTASAYANWIPGLETSCSERTIGRWLAARGNASNMVVATKGGHPAIDAPTVSRLDPDSISTDVLASIEHLNIERIQLFYLHRDDPQQPIGQILDTMEALVKEGLVEYYAASNFSADRLYQARQYASRKGCTGFVANQLEWSVAHPRPETIPADLTSMNSRLARFHLETQLTAIPYSSQARGYFERFSLEEMPATVGRYDTAFNTETAQHISLLAKKHGVANTTMALAGLRQSGISTIPVIGCRTIEQLRDSWSSLSVQLEKSESQWFASRSLTTFTRDER